ncbi:MAG: NAD-dependent epimerase/dehydratase family protein [Burkholderiales bacterium]
MSDDLSLLCLPVDDLDRVLNAVGPRWERLRNQRLLLTGGMGFIGKWLLATFLHANRRLGLSAHVIVLSRRPEAFLEQFPELGSFDDVTWLSGDVSALAPEAAGDCYFAIHAATDVVSASTPADMLDSCTVGTRRVLGRAYNVGGAEGLSIGELAHRVNSVLDGIREVRIAQTPRPGTAPQAYVSSVDRIAAELGLVPTVGLDDAILRTARWAAHTLRD